MIRKISKIVLLLCLLPASIKVLAAEGDESRLRRSTTSLGNTSQPGLTVAKDDELRKTLELVRNRKLVKELGLSEDKANVVLDKLRRVGELQKNYAQRRQSVISQLEKIVSSPNPEQSELKVKLQELSEIEVNYLNEKERAKKEMYEVLSPQQRAQYIVFQLKFQNELRRVITDIKKNNQTMSSLDGGTTIQRPREGNVLQNRRR